METRKDEKITQYMKNKLISIIKDFVDADETCRAVKEHFKYNNPKGPYFALAKYFQDKGENEDYIDKCYREWLSTEIENYENCESIVLSCLKGKYNTKEKLKNFVFLVNDEKPELNQKWHYFISYWGLREYATRYPENNIAKKPITVLKENAQSICDRPKNYVEELLKWYEYALSQQKMKKNN